MFFAGFEIVPMDVFGYMIGIYFILLDLLRPVIYCVYNKRGIKMTKLRTKIKILREQENMNQGELANQLGVKIETIVHLENGKYNPSLKMGIDIAKVFHTTVEDIFEFVEE